MSLFTLSEITSCLLSSRNAEASRGAFLHSCKKCLCFSQRLGGLCLFFLVTVQEVTTWGVVAKCQTGTAGITSFNLEEPVRRRLPPHFTDAAETEPAKPEPLPEGTWLESELS